MNKKLFLMLIFSLMGSAPAWSGDGDWGRARSAHERGLSRTGLTNAGLTSAALTNRARA